LENNESSESLDDELLVDDRLLVDRLEKVAGEKVYGDVDDDDGFDGTKFLEN
jgi:hypothetical protein